MGTGNEGAGRDDLSGYWTSSTVMQIPERLVTRNGQPVASADATNAVVGVWSTTERRKLEVTNASYGSRLADEGHGRKRTSGSRSRGSATRWSTRSSSRSARRTSSTAPPPTATLSSTAQFVTDPELAAVLNALFDVNAPETDRTDIVQAVLQGIPGLNEHAGKFAGTPVDTLKLNLGVAPSASPSRFGVIGGDNAGYPNGRRLTTTSSTSTSRWSPGSWSATRCRSATGSIRPTSRS